MSVPRDREEQAERRKRLEKEIAATEDRLEALYMDKINKEITPDQYKLFSTRWMKEKAEAQIALRNIGTEQTARIAHARRVLELCANAGPQFKLGSDEDKRNLLRTLTEGGFYANRTVSTHLRKPFDLMLDTATKTEGISDENEKMKEWLAVLDDF